MRRRRMIDGLPWRRSISCLALCFNENTDLLSCYSIFVLLVCISVIRILFDLDLYAISDVYIRLSEREIGQICKAQASYGMKIEVKLSF